MTDVSVHDDGVGVVAVSIDRPEKRNAMTLAVVQELAEAIESQADAAVIVLRSEGPVFSAGADFDFLDRVAALDDRDEIETVVYGHFQRLIRAITGSNAPVVCRLQGPALGAGADLVLACDVIVAAEGAWLEETWVRLGLVPALGAVHVLTRGLGRHRAFRAVTRPERLTVEELAAAGIVERVVPVASLPEATDTVTSELARGSREAVRAVKLLIAAADSGATFADHLDAARRAQSALLVGEDFRARLAHLSARRG